MELNRRYYRFDELKVPEKKLRFSGGLTEYIPPNPQLVKQICSHRNSDLEDQFWYLMVPKGVNSK